jgi:cyclopropane-fatty-acyl-phospholipid synthase
MLSNPDPGVGELYMDGAWRMEEGDLGAFLTMAGRNLQKLLQGNMRFLVTPLLQKRYWRHTRDIAGSAHNAQFHYDIGNDLYECFLDSGMNYSCAFFTDPGMSLREAQINKLRTTLDRLEVRRGMRLLDIGCGWGEMCITAAREQNATATGITLARKQLVIARDRVIGMKNRPTFLLRDYREHAADHERAYDRIVSVGMFEHVGVENYGPYFAAVHHQLKPGGRALIHSIVNAIHDAAGTLRSPWLEKYIFPGGRVPDLHEIMRAATAEGLRIVSKPYLQASSDYAETLRRWRGNFTRNYPLLDPRKYDLRFRRMWEYYLALCEGMFEGCGFQVGQFVFER